MELRFMGCLKALLVAVSLAAPLAAQAETALNCKVERFCTGPSCMGPVDEDFRVTETAEGFDLKVGEKMFAMTQAPTSDPATALRLTGTNQRGDLIILTVVPGGAFAMTSHAAGSPDALMVANYAGTCEQSAN
jgi:hypothetical protein